MFYRNIEVIVCFWNKTICIFKNGKKITKLATIKTRVYCTSESGIYEACVQCLHASWRAAILSPINFTYSRVITIELPSQSNVLKWWLLLSPTIRFCFNELTNLPPTTQMSAEKEERKAQAMVDDARAAVVRNEQSIAAEKRSLVRTLSFWISAYFVFTGLSLSCFFHPNFMDGII